MAVKELIAHRGLQWYWKLSRRKKAGDVRGRPGAGVVSCLRTTSALPAKATSRGSYVRLGGQNVLREPPRGSTHAFGGSMPARPDAEDALLERITVNLAIFGGKPILRGHRLAVEHVLGMLAAGDTPETILAGYPWMEAEDIRACLVYARRLVAHERVEPGLADSAA